MRQPRTLCRRLEGVSTCKLKVASCTLVLTAMSVVGLARISHTFCDTEAIRSEKVSRCKSLTAAGQADPFRQSVFQPSAGRLMDIGYPPQSASVFRAKCSPLAQCEKCGLTVRQVFAIILWAKPKSLAWAFRRDARGPFDVSSPCFLHQPVRPGPPGPAPIWPGPGRCLR